MRQRSPAQVVKENKIEGHRPSNDDQIVQYAVHLSRNAVSRSEHQEMEAALANGRTTCASFCLGGRI